MMIPWDRSPPFAVNPRGHLIHRVRYVVSINWNGALNHYNAQYLCNNSCNIDPDLVREILVGDPPRGKLLCSYCEAMATAKKMPSGDALAGRHVHRGVLVPQQVCCQKK